MVSVSIAVVIIAKKSCSVCWDQPLMTRKQVLFLCVCVLLFYTWDLKKGRPLCTSRRFEWRKCLRAALKWKRTRERATKASSHQKSSPFASHSRHGSYDHEKVLNFCSCLEKSLNSTKALEKYSISLLDLEMSLKFTTLSNFFLYEQYFTCFFILICTSDEIASHTESFCKVLLRKVV